MYNNLVKAVLANGGKIKPLIVPFESSQGTGQTNPSLYIENKKIYVNLRNVQYVLLHSENDQNFQSRYGPLAYLNPENDISLRTTNFYMELYSNLEVKRFFKVDTSKLDIKPVWEFIGLEDARMVHWDRKWFLCGVRRDVKPDGEGRMELSEIKIDGNSVKEIDRHRIEPPNLPSYCEKNWMPVIDMPYHFVKWSNPTQVVKVDMENNVADTVFLGEKVIQGYGDWRGGSSVINWGENRVAIVHEVDLFHNELGNKDAYYYHRFLVWDKKWNIVKLSDRFNFMTGHIEFCCGLGIIDDKMLFTFGYQDNAAYIVEAPLKFMEGFING